jgi:hypothetical protein
MRYPVILMSVPALPATATARNGAHPDMGIVERVMHQSGQHGLREVEIIFAAAQNPAAGISDTPTRQLRWRYTVVQLNAVSRIDQ